MNAHRSKHPGSGRPSSRFNPITGEELQSPQANHVLGQVSDGQDAKLSKPAYRPSNVPALNFGRMLDDDEAVHRRPTSSTNADGGDCSDRDSLYSVSSRWSVPRVSEAASVTAAVQPKQLAVSARDSSTASTSKGQLQQPYVAIPNVKKINAEEGEEGKRRDRLIEAVMADQLSRAVISQPEQDDVEGLAAGDLYHQPGMPRGHIRKLHESKVLTRGTPTENLLSQRVRFGARLLTRVSQDAVRDLTGFFFANDNSITIYEYKQFGKVAKALPFISKGCYVHPCGRKRGKSMTLADVVVGKMLVFASAVQAAVPASVKSQEYALVRVTDVDEEAKQRIILSGVRNSEKEAAWSKFHELTKDELRDMAIVRRVQAKVRHSFKKRAIKAISGLAAYFRGAEKAGASVSKLDFTRALDDFRVNLSSEELEDLWSAVDVDGNGILTLYEVLRGLLGEMNELRHSFVRKAFQKLDTSKQGAVSMSQLLKFFNASKHPHVCSGEISAVVLAESFLGHWSEATAVQGQVTFSEFEDYYEGLSNGIEADEDFVHILRSTWGL